MLKKPESFFTLSALKQTEVIKATFLAIAVASEGHPAWVEIYGLCVEMYNSIEELDISTQKRDFPSTEG